MAPTLPEPNLPTDSLYKMLTIAGLVLVVASLFIGWGARDAQMAAFIAERTAYVEMNNADALPKTRYARICADFRELDSHVIRLVRAVSEKALYEYKAGSGMPAKGPDIGETLTSPITKNREWGEVPIPAIKYGTGIEDWLGIVDRLYAHCDVYRDFLRPHNLANITEEQKAQVLQDVEQFETQIAALQETCFQLSDEDINHEAAILVLARADNDFRDAFIVSGYLFVLGFYVFTRGCYNWYEFTQKYQDAITKKQADGKSDPTPAVSWTSPRAPTGWLVREFLRIGTTTLLFILLSAGARFLSSVYPSAIEAPATENSSGELISSMKTPAGTTNAETDKRIVPR